MTYVIFETLSHFSRQPLYILLDQTLHTFYKSSLSKWNFLELPLLALKFTKFLTSFLEPRVSFSSNFASLFSVHFVHFHLIFISFGKKDLIKVQIFKLSSACMEIIQIPFVFFQAENQLSFKFCITL